MKRNKGMMMISALASVALLSGCSLLGSEKTSTQIDPPMTSETAADDAEAASAEVAANYTPTLYFADADGYVAPLSLPIAYDGVSYAKTVLEYMVKGGPEEGILPEGFTALLPEGTKVKSIDVNRTNRTAIVDFSKEFTKYEAKDERKILEAITWALTGFKTVDQVELRVEGQRLAEMPVAKTPLNEPLSRKFGINVELGKGVQYSRATPVTLYFQNVTADNYTYYVPVTRMINLTEDVASATVAELVKGPQEPNKLESVFMASVKANKIDVDGDNVKVDFDETLIGKDGKITADSLQALVLSLTDTLGSKGVQITVDGKTQAVGTDDKNYGEKPVNRPNQINKYEM